MQALSNELLFITLEPFVRRDRNGEWQYYSTSTADGGVHVITSVHRKHHADYVIRGRGQP